MFVNTAELGGMIDCVLEVSQKKVCFISFPVDTVRL